MKNPMERTRISMDLTIWEWLMIINALDSYIEKHGSEVDTLGILQFIHYIEHQIGFQED